MSDRSGSDYTTNKILQHTDHFYIQSPRLKLKEKNSPDNNL
jgi:hypothetical protein